MNCILVYNLKWWLSYVWISHKYENYTRGFLDYKNADWLAVFSLCAYVCFACVFL